MKTPAAILIMLLALVAAFDAAEASGACSVPSDLTTARPDPEGTPTEVAVGIYVIDLMKINDAEQTFTADFYFMVRWRDPRLSVNELGRSIAGCNLAPGSNNAWKTVNVCYPFAGFKDVAHFLETKIYLVVLGVFLEHGFYAVCINFYIRHICKVRL